MPPSFSSQGMAQSGRPPIVLNAGSIGAYPTSWLMQLSGDVLGKSLSKPARSWGGPNVQPHVPSTNDGLTFAIASWASRMFRFTASTSSGFGASQPQGSDVQSQ